MFGIAAFSQVPFSSLTEQTYDAAVSESAASADIFAAAPTFSTAVAELVTGADAFNSVVALIQQTDFVF